MKGFILLFLLSNLTCLSYFSQEIKSCSDVFQIENLEKRVIDNKGLGDERFMGTRNFRVVLYDLVYRGGGNNLHLKDTIPKYYLWNPLPQYGIDNLKQNGFDKAVYLYSTNFSYWYPEDKIKELKKNGFEYVCEPNLGEDYLKRYFNDIIERASDSKKGMVYIHCWNGWHQSGLLSAYTLMQFCDFTNAKALKYWENCTDGHHEGYEAVKKKIRNYKKDGNFNFTKEQKNKYCPCNNSNLSLNQKNNDLDSVNLTVNEMMERPESVINESTEQSNTINQTYTNYKVKAGDTLNAIARNNRTTVAEIKKINKLDSDVIRINQILKLPK